MRDEDKCNLLTPLVNTVGEKGRNDEKENSLYVSSSFLPQKWGDFLENQTSVVHILWTTILSFIPTHANTV